MGFHGVVGFNFALVVLYKGLVVRHSAYDHFVSVVSRQGSFRMRLQEGKSPTSVKGSKVSKGVVMVHSTKGVLHFRVSNRHVYLFLIRALYKGVLSGLGVHFYVRLNSKGRSYVMMGFPLANVRHSLRKVLLIRTGIATSLGLYAWATIILFYRVLSLAILRGLTSV